MPMALKQLEAEVKKLKKQVEENAKAKDFLEIWKLQSTYAHLYHVGRNSEVPDLFAQKTPGVTMEIEDSGVYKERPAMEVLEIPVSDYFYVRLSERVDRGARLRQYCWKSGEQTGWPYNISYAIQPLPDKYTRSITA